MIPPSDPRPSNPEREPLNLQVGNVRLPREVLEELAQQLRSNDISGNVVLTNGSSELELILYKTSAAGGIVSTRVPRARLQTLADAKATAVHFASTWKKQS